MSNKFILIFSLVAGMLFTQCACTHASSYGDGGKNTIIKTDKPDISSDRYEKTLSDNIVYANALAIADGDVGMQGFDILKNGDILACGTRHSALYFGTVPEGNEDLVRRPWNEHVGRGGWQ